MENETAVGQYVLGRKIGQGGMAEVWEGLHTHLHNRVAIKFLLPRFAGDPELEERFLNEGKRQAQLQHPNIVPAIDFLQVNGRSYLVMNYVDGANLETRLHQQQGPLPLDEIHAISWDVLSALDYAHSHGVVHRDVKPSNILLDKSGRVFLTDFGIALALSEERHITRTGSVIGTPDYMSPEQILRPKQVDARSDIYSFGCVLYAMLTGGPPFGIEGATEFYIKDCHVRNAPPSLIDRNPGLSPALEQVVLTCMEKDPGRRFQNGAAIMAAFDSAMHSQPSPMPAPRPSGIRESTVLEQRPTPPPRPVRVTPSPTPPVPAPPPPVLPPPPARKKSLLWPIVIGALLLVALFGAYKFWFSPGKIGASPQDIALRLEGSTTVGDALAPALVQAFLKHEGATNITDPQPGKASHQVLIQANLPGDSNPKTFSIIANGSGNAFTALENGSADVGMASRQIKPAEADMLRSHNLGNMFSPACEKVVGLDGLAIVVNASNPIQVLDRSQVARIFRGEITDWSAVGGKPGPIELFGRDTKSGTFDTFVALVLNGRKESMSHNITIKDSGDEISKVVASNPAGIGFVGIAQIGGSKALAISDGPGTTALLPTRFTVATEDYILSRRLYLYLPENASELARRFANFAIQSDGQEVVKRIGYVEQTGKFESDDSIPASAPAEYRSLTASKHRMRTNFRFQAGSDELDNKALVDINRAIMSLQQFGIRRVELFGFADSKGGFPINKVLSEKRAQVVADQFSRAGIECDIRGFSYLMPVGDNRTEEGRRRNRRVEVWATVPASALSE